MPIFIGVAMPFTYADSILLAHSYEIHTLELYKSIALQGVIQGVIPLKELFSHKIGRNSRIHPRLHG